VLNTTSDLTDGAQPADVAQPTDVDALLDPQLGPETHSLGLNLLLSLVCSVSMFFATWPFGGMTCSWFWKRHQYSWNTHVMMTWANIGCLGLFLTNLYAVLVYPDLSRELSVAGVAGGLPFTIWRGNYSVNSVMQLLWGLHNLQQWIMIMRGADRGTEFEWRRPLPIFLWSILGAPGAAFIRNFIHLQYGLATNRTVWAPGFYEVFCQLLILADLVYFLVFEFFCGMNAVEGEEKEED